MIKIGPRCCGEYCWNACGASLRVQREDWDGPECPRRSQRGHRGRHGKREGLAATYSQARVSYKQRLSIMGRIPVLEALESQTESGVFSKGYLSRAESFQEVEWTPQGQRKFRRKALNEATGCHHRLWWWHTGLSPRQQWGLHSKAWRLTDPRQWCY